MILGSFWCRLYGHKWGRAKDYPILDGPTRIRIGTERGKNCVRCNEYALVKTRKPSPERPEESR